MDELHPRVERVRRVGIRPVIQFIEFKLDLSIESKIVSRVAGRVFEQIGCRGTAGARGLPR